MTIVRMRVPCPRSWNAVPADEVVERLVEEELESHIEVGPPGNDRACFHTGRTEPTALLWSTVPDGRERLVAILRPEDLDRIRAVWEGSGWVGSDRLTAKVEQGRLPPGVVSATAIAIRRTRRKK